MVNNSAAFITSCYYHKITLSLLLLEFKNYPEQLIIKIFCYPEQNIIKNKNYPEQNIIKIKKP
jgi:hypothetical protein